MPDIATKPYKLTPGRIGRHGVDLWLGRWWWACALPLAALLVGACFDVRCLIAALALALVAYPGILMFAFYTYALSPAAARLTLTQTATFGTEALTITYLPSSPKDAEEDADVTQRQTVDEKNKKDHSTATGPDAVCLRVSAPLVIPYSAISKAIDTGSAIQINYNSPAQGWLEIPASSLGAQYDQAFALLPK